MIELKRVKLKELIKEPDKKEVIPNQVVKEEEE